MAKKHVYFAKKIFSDVSSVQKWSILCFFRDFDDLPRLSFQMQKMMVLLRQNDIFIGISWSNHFIYISPPIGVGMGDQCVEEYLSMVSRFLSEQLVKSSRKNFLDLFRGGGHIFLLQIWTCSFSPALTKRLRTHRVKVAALRVPSLSQPNHPTITDSFLVTTYLPFILPLSFHFTYSFIKTRPSVQYFLPKPTRSFLCFHM